MRPSSEILPSPVFSNKKNGGPNIFICLSQVFVLVLGLASIVSYHTVSYRVVVNKDNYRRKSTRQRFRDCLWNKKVFSLLKGFLEERSNFFPCRVRKIPKQSLRNRIPGQIRVRKRPENDPEEPSRDRPIPDSNDGEATIHLSAVRFEPKTIKSISLCADLVFFIRLSP